MAGRRWMPAIFLVAALLHATSITRSHVPAQDGLKFIRIARQFHTTPWPDVVRDSDQHPLYPALIAATEPFVRAAGISGPDAWRIAAQLVAAAASLAILVPLYQLTRSLFDGRIACIAAAIYVLLPVPAEVGHDTLGDSLGLLCTLLALRWGAVALRTRCWHPALAAGMAGGIGYLARPETVLALVAVGLVWLALSLRTMDLRAVVRSPVMPAMGLSAMVLVGSYALVKGQVSEKLALRHGASLGAQEIKHRNVPQWLPKGLDDARWDFSPKEETERAAIKGPGKALHWLATEWFDELCWGFAIMTVWGLVRSRFILRLCQDRDPADSGRMERWVLATFAAVFLLIVVRHGTSLGYLSGRHVLPMVLISVPWAAAGTFVCLRGLGVKLPWSHRTAWTACVLASSLVIGVLVAYQIRPSHPTRWGHWAAGRWLNEHAGPSEVVLDTRGWARFVAAVPGYDYWHVRQALTDSHLAYIVVGHDELAAESSRARTLTALLDYAATPVVDFPMMVGDRDAGVRVYRFHRPGSWEGMAQ